AVLAGLAGGILVAAAAGARRTDSALERSLVAYRFRDARVWGDGTGETPSLLRPIEHFPQVAAASIGQELALGSRDVHGLPTSYLVGPHAVRFYASTDGHDGVTLDRWKLLAGRRPNSNRPDEALLDSRAARTFGVGPGDTIGVHLPGRRVPLRVVGVVAATDPVIDPGGVVRLTPAFYRDQPRAPYFDFV